MALADGVRDFIDIKWPLGNQDDVGAPGDAAVKGDPSRIAAHHFHHHHAVMSFCGGVDAIERLAHDITCGVESKSVIGAAEVVVDRLRNSHHVGATLVEFLRDRESVVAADRDQRLNLIFLQRGQAAVDAIRTLRRIGARGAQDGAAARQNASDRLEIENHIIVVD
jgi:hypothetical protein